MSEDVKRFFRLGGYGTSGCWPVVTDPATVPPRPDKYEVALAVAQMLIEKWMLCPNASKVTDLVKDIVAVLP